MNFREMESAIADAQRTQNLLEGNSEALAKLLVGNLRNVNRRGGYYQNTTLKKLKAELSQYNARSGVWKN